MAEASLEQPSSEVIIDGPGPTATSPSTLSRARSGFKNFSRRFDRRPKSVKIDKLPQSAAPTNIDGSNTTGGTVINHNAEPQVVQSQPSQHVAPQGELTPPITPTKPNTKTARDSGIAYGPPPATPPDTTGINASMITPPKTPDGHKHRISTSSTISSPPPNLRPPLPHRIHSQIFASSADFKLPELPWLCGTWYVTHSSLPIWRDKRDVRVTYTRIPGDKLEDVVAYRSKSGISVATATPGSAPESVLGADGEGKQEFIRGVDKVMPDGSYQWRGKGFGMVKVGKWEVLGWGGGGGPSKDKTKEDKAMTTASTSNNNDRSTTTTARESDSTAAADPASSKPKPDPNPAEQWIITYFSKTMFSPAGISICSRKREGLSAKKLKKLLEALNKLDAVLLQEDRGGKRSEEGKGDFGRLVQGIVEIPR